MYLKKRAYTKMYGKWAVKSAGKDLKRARRVGKIKQRREHSLLQKRHILLSYDDI
jgi:hypothetical protein